MNRCQVGALVVLVLAGCADSRPAAAAAPASPSATAAAPAATGAAQPAPNPEIDKLFQREVAPLPVQAFASAAGLTGRVEATAPPRVTAGQGAETIRFSIGASTDVQCEFYARRQLRLGEGLYNIVQKVKKRAEVEAVGVSNVVAVEGSPIVFAQLIYLVDSPEGKRVGQLKMAFAPRHSLLCQHDQPGYSATFERVVKGLVGSLRSPREDVFASARYTEVQVTSLSGLPVGYSFQAVLDSRSGGSAVESHETVFFPRSPTDFFAVDEDRFYLVDTEGILLAQKSTRLRNADVEHRFELKRQADGRTYRYEGTLHGKKLEGTFQPKKQVSTSLSLNALYSAEAGYGPAGEQRFEIYEPEVNPVAATEVVYRKDAAKPRQVDFEVAGERFSTVVDEQGWPQHLETPVGGATLVYERAWSRGKP